MAGRTILVGRITRMEFIKEYEDPNLEEMTKAQLIALVHRTIHLITSDRVLSEAVFNYTPSEMDGFIELIQNALSARKNKPELIELIEALYGDPSLRELYAASKNNVSQRIHKRARRGGGGSTRGCKRGSRRRR